MALQAETRSAGRHRREQAGRHRAPRSLTAAGPLRSSLSLAGPLGSDRGRAILLTAALSSALITGVAGGSAAAAAGSTDPVALVTATPAAEPDTAATTPGTDADAGPDASAVESVGPWKPPAAGTASAEQRKVKPRALAPVRAKMKTPAATGWVNPNPTGRVTSCYGQRWGRLHAGVDIAAADGSPILAAGAGVVVRAGEAQGYGLAVLVDHGNGYLTHYGHMSAIAVHEGQRVEAGEQIGNEGSTGHSTGPHLHFEVHQGFYKNPIEPTAWLREHGVTVPGC